MFLFLFHNSYFLLSLGSVTLPMQLLLPSMCLSSAVSGLSLSGYIVNLVTVTACSVPHVLFDFYLCVVCSLISVK